MGNVLNDATSLDRSQFETFTEGPGLPFAAWNSIMTWEECAQAPSNLGLRLLDCQVHHCAYRRSKYVPNLATIACDQRRCMLHAVLQCYEDLSISLLSTRTKTPHHLPASLVHP